MMKLNRKYVGMLCRTGAACLALGSSGCTTGESADSQIIEVNSDNPEANLMSWEEFATASTFEGPNGPVYVAEGDLPFADLKGLKAYYYEHYLAQVDKLAVKTFNGGDDRWFNNEQTRLEYCVSTTFPATGFWSRANTIAAMEVATQSWKQVANVHFTYVPGQDSNCTTASGVPHTRFFKVAPTRCRADLPARSGQRAVLPARLTDSTAIPSAWTRRGRPRSVRRER